MTNPVHPERQGPPFSLPHWTPRHWLETLLLLGLTPLVGIAALVLAGVDNRVVDLLAQFMAPLLIAMVLLTGGLARLRLRTPAALGLLTSLLLILAVWPQWFPRKTNPDP